MIQFAVKATIVILFQVLCARALCAQELSSTGITNRQITVLFQAFDQDQTPVKNIRAEDLKISQDGKPARVISVQQLKDAAVSIVLLIDVSLSQERTLPAQKLAATKFLAAVIDQPRDQAAVATFTNDLQVEQQFTANLDSLRIAVNRAAIAYPPDDDRGGLVVGPPPKPSNAPPGSTAIWDVIVSTCNSWRGQSDPSVHRAIVLLTDGRDTSSKSKMSAAIQCANGKGISVYSVGIGDSNFGGVDRSILRKMSEETGGAALFPKKDTDLIAQFEQLGTVFRNEYQLIFARNDSSQSFSKIRIELINPQFKNVRLSYQHSVSR